MYVRVAPRRLDARWRLHWSMGVEHLHTCILQGTTTTTWGPTHHPGTWETSTPQSAGTPSIPTTPRFARSARSPVGPDRPPRPSLPMPFHGDAAAPNGGGALDGRRTASLGVQHKGWAGHAGGSAVPRGTGGALL